MGRAHGRTDLACSARPIALPRNGSARATPAPRGLAPSSRSRPCERWRSARWPSSARARSRCRPRTLAASRSRSTVSKAPTGSASSESRRWPMAAAAHDGAAARAASMTHAERVETVRRAHGGAPLPWAHRPAAAGIRVGRRLCRGLSRHPAEVGARSVYRHPSREFTGHPAGAGARFACRRRGACCGGRRRGAGCG